jgi:hypothetical protein
MEFVIVIYPTRRSVYVDDILTGDTNESLWMDAGTPDLGPVDYDRVQDVVVAETRSSSPESCLCQKARQPEQRQACP